MKIITTIIVSLIAGIAMAQEARYVCAPEDIGLFPMENLNTKSIEFSPTYYSNGLVYVVAKEKSNFLDPKTGRAYFDLMYTDIGPDGLTGKSIPFSPNIRTQYHEGPCTFSADGNEMFFTRSNLSGGQGINDEKGLVQLKIYSAVKGEEDWEQILELPFCDDQYAVAHPALSADGLSLVFASDMPGGYGEMDLYIVRRENGVWAVPVNLGDAINSKGNEVFPYLHPEGYLFFSSDGHEGKGGLDLFVTTIDSGEVFQGIQHLEAPFNSNKDDLGMIVSADGTSGYVASDRKPTKGKDDLYRWTSPKSIFCQSLKGPRGTLFQKEIMVVDDQGRGLSKSYVWLIPMSQEGPTLYKDHFTTTLVEKADKEGDFYLQWSMTDTLTTSTADGITDPGGKALLEADAKATYVVVARQNGYLPYTEVLSGDQIPSSIVLKKMAGDDASCLQTLFSVYNADGDIELNGAKIQLTGPCLKEAMVFYTDEFGSARKCLPKGCALKAEFIQEGYAQHAFTFTPDEADEHWKIYLQNSGKLTAPASPIASGTVIVLDNIYYDFNQSAIRKGESGELIALADVLKQYPDLTIELTSHTDTRGTSEYNMELSARRSESSKSYLVLLGVDASRILTKAAGESAPRNKCVDGVPCTNAEHQYNRRTEVRIINPAQGMQIKYKAEG